MINTDTTTVSITTNKKRAIVEELNVVGVVSTGVGSRSVAAAVDKSYILQ